VELVRAWRNAVEGEGAIGTQASEESLLATMQCEHDIDISGSNAEIGRREGDTTLDRLL
jgi:hypothetical protein